MATEIKLGARNQDHTVACFAPPLTDELLEKYKTTLEGIEDPQLQEMAQKLFTCVRLWWDLPESKGSKFRVRGPAGLEAESRELTDDLRRQLWDAIPWESELNLCANNTRTGLFQALPPGDLKNALFHLLWFVWELNGDREPVTQDKEIR